MTSKLVFISDNVRDADFFINNSLPDVTYVQLNSKESIDDVQQKLSLLDLSNITNIGILFDNNCGRAPFITYTVTELEQERDLQQKCQEKLQEYNSNNNNTKFQKCQALIEDDFLFDSSFLNSNLFFSKDFYDLLIEIKNKSNVNIIDIISCNISENSQFGDLEKEGIIVRYSTNITGLNGDWILESHNINVAPIYFTENIVNYKYRLGAETPVADINGNFVIYNADTLYWLMTYNTNSGSAPNLSSTFTITNNIDMNDVTGGGPSVYPTESIARKFGVVGNGNGNRFIGKILGNNKRVIIRDIDYTKFSGFIGNLGRFTGVNTFGYLQDLTVTFADNIFSFPILSGMSNTNMIYGLLIGINRAGDIDNCEVNFLNPNPVIITLENQVNTIPVPDLGVPFIEFGIICGRKQIECNFTNCRVTHTNNITINVYSKCLYTAGSFIGNSISSILATKEISNNTVSITGDLEIKGDTTNVTLFDGIPLFIGGFVGSFGINAAAGVANLTRIWSNKLTCRNLNINNLPITTVNANFNMIFCLGGFIGYLDRNNDIFNCSLVVNGLYIISDDDSGNNTDNTKSHSFYGGGFVGYITTNTVAQSTIRSSSCSTDILSISIIADALTNIRLENWIGGFCGKVFDNNQILGCGISANQLAFNITSALSLGEARVGGFIGECDEGSIVSGVGCFIQQGIFFINTQNTFQHIGGLMGFGALTSQILNSSATFSTLSIDCALNTQGVFCGGLLGTIRDSAIFNNNTLNILQLKITTRSLVGETNIGGLAARIDGTSTVNNCTCTVGPASSLISLLNTDDVYIGGLIGNDTTTGVVQNNTIFYTDAVTFKANQTATVIGVNSLVGLGTLNGTNNNVFLKSYPLVFQSIFNGTGINFEGTNYLIQPGILTIQTNPYFLIDLSDITVYVYLRFVSPLGSSPPCCVANICDANPQTANYSNENVVHNASGAQLVTAVSQFYSAAAAGQARPNAPPIFKTYQQMMDWKQRQNRR